MKRTLFWLGFIIVLVLIVWGLIVAMNKTPSAVQLGTPAEVTDVDHVRGPADAPVTIIEYSDFQCPACAIYFPWVERLVAESSTTIRMVYRHYPLPQHGNAMLASQASEAASNQGKFWEMYAEIFENQKKWEVMTKAEARAEFVSYAVSMGLNKQKFELEIDSEATKDRVTRDSREGVNIGINSTPTFFINGQTIVNPASYEAFKKLVEETAKNSSK